MPKPGLCTYVRGLGGQYCPSVNGYKVGIWSYWQYDARYC